MATYIYPSGFTAVGVGEKIGAPSGQVYKVTSGGKATPISRKEAVEINPELEDALPTQEEIRNATTTNAGKYQITAEMRKQAEKDPYYAKQIQDPNLLRLLVDNPDEAYKLRLEDRSNSINSVRSQLETQYNNLVSYDPRLAYQGRAGDLPTIFNQQAAQLADAGVTNIGDLRVQDGRLVNSSTGKVVTNSNLGGQVAVDRDTGVQKWGDIFSGVQGGANYGIQSLQDGSVVLFPAWEKTKSPIAQIGLGGLESVITPILTVSGAVLAGPVGGSAVAGAAAGAAAGSSAGQLLASGSIDWEKVALAAGGAAAGQAAFGGAGSEVTADLTGTTTSGMLGSDAGFAVAEGAGSAAGGGAGAAGALDLPSYGLLDTTTFPADGIKATASTTGGASAPFATTPAYSELTTVIPAGGGAATVPGLVAPGISNMGGGTGLLAPVQGGVVSELGFVPTGATPSLGDPSSFINNPDYLGSPVISEDYLGLTASDMPSGMGIQDALRMARTGMQLFGPQQQQLLGMGGYGGGGGQAAGVDASGLLGLLQGKAGVPGVAPLLTPVSIPAAQPQPLLGLQMPQYQPLLGTTTQSLLG